jgi:hypothetical protein
MNIANFSPIVSAVTAPVIGALTDRSMNLDSGDSVELAPAKASRGYFLFQNISDAAMWLNFGAAATANNNSIYVATQGSVLFNGSFIPNQTINVLCPTASGGSTKRFVAKEG